MENLGYYNGKFGPLEEMQVPMLDRVCFFGDGCYDATYSSRFKVLILQWRKRVSSVVIRLIFL